MAKKTKRQKEAIEAIDPERKYPLGEAVALVKKHARLAKFDETVEVAMNLGVDPRHADQRLLAPSLLVPKTLPRPFRMARRVSTGSLQRLT